MSFTIADALTVSPLSYGRLVAGSQGSANEIKTVDVLEVNPLDVPLLDQFWQPQNLAISSLYSVMDSVEDQINVIRIIHRCGLSGLVLCHIGIVMKELDQRLIDACDEIGFPLILMPPKISYKEIISAVSDALFNMQNAKLRRAMEIYDSLISMLIEEKDTGTLIAALSNIINRKVAYFNHNAVALHAQALPSGLIQYIGEQVKAHSAYFINHKEETTISCPESEGDILLVPVFSSASYFGVIAVLGNEPLSDLDKIAIAQTKNALSISALNKINIAEQRKLLLSDFINDLVRGNFSDEGVMQSRGEALNCNVSQTCGVIVLDLFNFQSVAATRPEANVQQLKNEFFDQVESQLLSLSPSAVATRASDKVIILFMENHGRQKTIQRMQYIGHTLLLALKSSLKLQVTAGIGAYCERISDIKASYETALSAIRISNRIFLEPRCACYNDFPVYALLLQTLGGDSESKSSGVICELMRPLKEYDEANHSELEKTFRMLLGCDLDTGAVAKEMFLHKNTVLQRKKKITSLYKNNPFSLVNRLQFEIAFVLENLFYKDQG